MHCPACHHLNAPDNTVCVRCGALLRAATTTISRAACPPGQVLAGRYRVEALLGEGAMGTVYRVVELASGRTSALKLLRPTLTESSTARARMSREMLGLARVRHPNVVELREVVPIGETLALELELAEGGTLAARLGNGPLGTGPAIRILGEVLGGLEAIHAAGLIHRDLKPGNILLAADGTPKIADLGIARDAAAPLLTAPGTVLGTPEYMSPEQIRGVQVGPESDVYACGVMLYEMLTGKVPFVAARDRDVLVAHLQQAPELGRLPPDLPEHVREAVAVALEKSPERRWHTARAMREVLAAGAMPAATQRLGEYTICRLVGEGGMGRVYEAEERLTRRRVALKVLRSEIARSAATRHLFLNEMAILAKLDHPNVVRCLACLEVDGELVMVLEFLRGHTLRQRLGPAGRLGWNDAVQVTSRIASALECAHAMTPPVVHRDLKPENVMLLEDGGVKVMDFGIAKVLDSVQRTSTLSVGTLAYMSPEQIDARPVDARSDLYSLGLVLYEILAGQPPFRSESQRELLNLMCTAPPPAFPEQVRAGLPPAIEWLTFQLLQKAPEARPPSARAVLDVLAPLTGGWSSPTHQLPSSPNVSPPAVLGASSPAARAASPPVAPPRWQVPLGLALVIIAALSALAGATAFLLRVVL